MSRFLSVIICCLIGAVLSTCSIDKKKIDFDEDEDLESEENPDYLPVTELTINSAIPFSNVLVNYTNTGINTQAGAINCLVVSRTDSNLILAGAANGGVWISHNCASTWQPVNDTARTLCVTSIVQNVFRPNEFYYSTGVDITENGHLLFDIYHSTDYGQTFSVVTPTGNSFGKVTKILASPLDSNTLYFLHSNSSTQSGTVYRTTDNCNSFQLVYQTNTVIDDMVLLPDGTLEIGYSHSVWRSNTGNFGTFVQSTGLPTSGYDTHLAFCRSRPDIQYCAIGVSPGFDIYKSLDTGRTWTYISHSSGGRRIEVKPDDPDFILTGLISTFVSTDGGLTWQQIIAGHDLRSFNFSPHRIGKVYITSDFGIATIEVDPITSTSFSREYRADTLLYVQEAYYGDHGATGIQSLQGYQDLGSRFIQTMNQSRYMMSGDGEYSFISKQNMDIGYFSAFGGDIFRHDHMTTTNLNPVSILNQLDANNDGNVDDQTMLVQPFMMNNANDSQLYFPTFHWLWRSTDRGTNWTQVSHYQSNSFADVTIACTHKPNPIVYWTHSDSVFVLANAATAAPLSEFGRTVPFDPGRCFADPDNDSALYILNRYSPPRISHCADLFDNASTWTDIPTTLLQGITIQTIAVYPGNDQVILAGAKEGGLYVTLNRGITWTKEASMPNVQITEIKIRESDKKVFIFTYGRGTWTADFSLPLSVPSTFENVNASVYPNPFKDQITVELKEEVKGNVEFTDMNGKLCLKKNFSGKEIKIHTEDIAPGFYVITVSDGSKIVYQTKGIRVKE